MYSTVPPPDNSASEVERSDEKQNERPPRGVSEDMWKKFQELKERRIKCCKASTRKRIKDINRNVRKTVLGNFKTDEEIAVLRVEGVEKLTCTNRPNQGSDKHDKKNTKGSEERWRELQHYLSTPDAQSCSAKTSDKPTTKDIIEKRLDTAVREKKFDKAEKLNHQLAQCDFAVKVARAVERRDYAKRKTAEDDRARKRKKTKPYWAFEQKHRWESKGNM